MEYNTRRLNSYELSILEEFIYRMREEVIPEIVNNQRRNSELVTKRKLEGKFLQ